MTTFEINYVDPFNGIWFIAASLIILTTIAIIFIGGLAEWKHYTLLAVPAIIIGAVAGIYCLLWLVRLATILFL